MLDDDQGVAFADLRICEAHIELAQLKAARQECANALTAFSAAGAADSVEEAQSLIARIELGEGHAERALVILNGVLDRDGADLAPRRLAQLYESRAQANAARQRYRDAYRDLEEYLGRYVAANDAERREQAGALRARFETDREIERNASLKHELTESREQSSRHARQLKWNAVVVIAGVCVIALLIYFLVANFRYRQRLIKLASLDGLTGLANRRRIAQVAQAALDAANSTGRPCASPSSTWTISKNAGRDLVRIADAGQLSGPNTVRRTARS